MAPKARVRVTPNRSRDQLVARIRVISDRCVSVHQPKPLDNYTTPSEGIRARLSHARPQGVVDHENSTAWPQAMRRFLSAGGNGGWGVARGEGAHPPRQVWPPPPCRSEPVWARKFGQGRGLHLQRGSAPGQRTHASDRTPPPPARTRGGAARGSERNAPSRGLTARVTPAAGGRSPARRPERTTLQARHEPADNSVKGVHSCDKRRTG